MSRNVNKIFFADLEILDLTNLTHCLTIIQYQTIRTSNAGFAQCEDYSATQGRFHLIRIRINLTKLSHCPDLMLTNLYIFQMATLKRLVRPVGPDEDH